jgi:hypothetical protein
MGASLFSICYRRHSTAASRHSYGAYGAYGALHFTLDTFDWPSISCTEPPNFGSSACPGTFIESFDFRPVANDASDPNFQLVDPDLNPIRTQEFTLGLDRELTKTMSVGVRYVHKPDQQFFSDWDPDAVAAATPNFRRDARYRMASGYQERRSIRLQAKFSF